MIWRPVVGWDGWYEVSDHGAVRRIKRARGTRTGILRQQPNGYGRLTVTLRRPGHREQRQVHRLVARAFIGEPREDQEVNHSDGDPTNNHAGNLEWVTAQQNIAHAVRLGLYTGPRHPAKGDMNGSRRHPERLVRGGQHPQAKLTEDDVRAIRKARGRISGIDLAARYGVTPTNITAIQKRRSWAHVS